MEPVSLLLASGAAAAYAAHRAEMVSRRARTAPMSLPDMMSAPVGDESAVAVIAVHIRQAVLVKQFANQRFKMRVKYGPPGNSICCDSREVHVPGLQQHPGMVYSRRRQEPLLPTADFGTTCLFLEQHRPSEAVLRFRLRRGGMFGQTLAEAELLIGFLSSCVEEREVRLRGVGADSCGVLGLLRVAVERQVVTKGDFRKCLDVLDAKAQNGAFLTGATPIESGQVVQEPDDGDVDSNPVIYGQPLGLMDGTPLVAADMLEVRPTRSLFRRRLRTLTLTTSEQDRQA